MPGPGTIATLATFFDQVLLPYPFGMVTDALPPDANSSSPYWSNLRGYTNWRSEWDTLFRKGILQTLERPQLPSQLPSRSFWDGVMAYFGYLPNYREEPGKAAVDAMMKHISFITVTNPSPELGLDELQFFLTVSGRLALAVHNSPYARMHPECPQLFQTHLLNASPADLVSTDDLANTLLTRTLAKGAVPSIVPPLTPKEWGEISSRRRLKFFVPSINPTNADDILALRDDPKIVTMRESMRDYLDKWASKIKWEWVPGRSLDQVLEHAGDGMRDEYEEYTKKMNGEIHDSKQKKLGLALIFAGGVLTLLASPLSGLTLVGTGAGMLGGLLPLPQKNDSKEALAFRAFGLLGLFEGPTPRLQDADNYILQRAANTETLMRISLLYQSLRN